MRPITPLAHDADHLYALCSSRYLYVLDIYTNRVRCLALSINTGYLSQTSNYIIVGN